MLERGKNPLNREGIDKVLPTPTACFLLFSWLFFFLLLLISCLSYDLQENLQAFSIQKTGLF